MLSIIVPVYRNASAALRLLNALDMQVLPPEYGLEVIVVDDGSGDDTPNQLAAANYPFLRVLTLPQNSGRSNARNAGASQARGKYLIFIDCDCLPADTGFVTTHINMLEGGMIASCGPLSGHGTGFWKRYQDEASTRRALQYVRGMSYVGTTANFAVRTEVFRAIGGFDKRYIHYGFEDRDMLVRLSQHGLIGWCPNAIMQHLDTLNLPEVLAKIREAGGESANLFAIDHLSIYRELGYAAIDTRIHRWLRFIGTLFGPVLGSAPLVERLLDSRLLPYPMGRIAVKWLTALAFLRGSMDS